MRVPPKVQPDLRQAEALGGLRQAAREPLRVHRPAVDEAGDEVAVLVAGAEREPLLELASPMPA